MVVSAGVMTEVVDDLIVFDDVMIEDGVCCVLASVIISEVY